jgi:hypothetical protein
MQVIRASFPGKPTSHFADITWPNHSPDLAVPDYFFWGYVKSKGRTFELKQQIQECIEGIPKKCYML